MCVCTSSEFEGLCVQRGEGGDQCLFPPAGPPDPRKPHLLPAPLPIQTHVLLLARGKRKGKFPPTPCTAAANLPLVSPLPPPVPSAGGGGRKTLGVRPPRSPLQRWALSRPHSRAGERVDHWVRFNATQCWAAALVPNLDSRCVARFFLSLLRPL